MNQISNLRKVFHFSFFIFILLLSLPLISNAQCDPRYTGSGLGCPSSSGSSSSSSSSSSYVPYTPPPESYIPTPLDNSCDAFRGDPDVDSCYVDRPGQGITVVHITVILRRTGTPINLNVERRASESESDFKQRYNAEIIDRLLRAGVNPNSNSVQKALYKCDRQWTK